MVVSDDNEGAYSGMEVAVVGMACRFPGASDVEQFWRNLCDGVESLTELTDEGLIESGENPALVALPGYVKVARTIENDDQFDAALFGFSPREAELVDPQQRLFLELSHAALEHAGYDSERFPGPVGVFGGIKMTSYIAGIYSNPALLQQVGELNAQIANDRDYLATRVSYKLGLRGPSMTVQSACSTSLVAVHLGCQALLAGECDMALAGGVSVRTRQRAGYVYREGDILSPEGRIRAFDARANGTIFGNGAGVVVLRRLDDAIAAGDRIWAVIRGTAVNNDGDLKVGYTAPGADGQERVIRAALGVSDVHPESISYVEAHGTGTLVGDPIEVTALTRAYRAYTERKGYCAIGTVKTNIGHLASAAGVAGLIKTALALDRKTLPPSLNFERPNPQIDFDDSPFTVQTALAPWQRNGAPLRAGVSAFGIGGTNAHAILEEAPAPEPSGPSRPWQLVLLSTRTETALETATANLVAHLESHPEQPFADACYTLQVGRQELEQRRFAVCRDREDAIATLGSLAPKRVHTAPIGAKNPRIAFLFSGQGSQHAGMFADLYATEAAFRETVDRAAEILLPQLGLDLRGLLVPAPERRAEAERELEQTRVAQPALFVVEVALARTLMAWGLEPDAMLGHSIGEFVAAHLAGVLSFDDALTLVATRGRLMQALPPGGMLAVPMSEAEVAPRLGKQLSLAATNAPSRVVVSGPEEAIAALESELAAAGKGARRLHTSHAFHSQMMEPVLGPFLAAVSRVELRAPERPYLSNVTGTWITAAEATDPAYWVRHLRGCVRFAEGVAELFAEPDRVLLEVGPGQSLATLARQHPARQANQPVIAAARHPKDAADDLATLLGALGQLWLAGAAIDWRGFASGESRRRVVLPGYPYERRRFWVSAPKDAALAGRTGPPQKKPFDEWFYAPYWRPAPPVLPLAAEAELPAGRWLIFADDSGLGVALAERVGTAGREALTVVAGRRFADLGGGVFEIDPSKPEDYDALLAAATLGEEGKVAPVPVWIAHCWGVVGGGGGPEGAAVPSASPAAAGRSETALELGFSSLLYLAQALGRQRLDEPVRLVVVTTGAASVDGRETLAPEKAAVLGPVKVIPQEYQKIAASSVDVEWGAAAGAAAVDTVAQLIAEIVARRDEALVAYRGGRRLTQAFQATPLDRTVEERLPLVDRGVYLITGGFGGIGLVLAEHLAERFHARLVLTGRSPLPPREEWAAWLAEKGEDDAQSRRMRQVERLEGLGAEVLVGSADVSDLESMRAVVAAVKERFGPVRGVIHAAGIAGGGVIQLKTHATAMGVLEPKLRGARVLEAVLEGEPLDFFVLCSSTIALFGNFGQVDYCGANNVLDLFAHDLAARRGIAAVSINWGAWKEVGMAVNTVVPTALTTGPRHLEATLDESAPPRHPLAAGVSFEERDRRVFAARFVPGELWVIDEHMVGRKPTLPGTGHLEMVRAACAPPGAGEQLEIADVFFFNPIIVPEGQPRDVRLVFEARGAGHDFKVVSRPVGSDAAWSEHSMGRVVKRSLAIEHYDLDALRERIFAESVAVEGRLLNNAESLVFWGDRWQVLKRVGSVGDEMLGELELPERFAADLAEWRLHPALLDVATALSGLHEEGESYLPLSYGKLRIAADLPAHLYSYIRRRPQENRETKVADIVLIDEAGRGVVEIEGFTMKRVGEAAARLRAPDAAKASPAAASPAVPAAKPESLVAQGGMTNAEGLEAFRRVLAARLGAQVAISPRDLPAMLEQISRQKNAALEAGGKSAAPKREQHPRSVRTTYVEPRTELETSLAEIWQDALGIDRVGVHDNFFEMGGDSVLGIQIVTRARELGLELATNQLFEHQTVAELAVALGDQAPASIAPASAAAATTAAAPFALAKLSEEALERLLAGLDAEDVYPLSPLQQGFLFHSIEAAGSALYIEQMTADLEGDLEIDALVAAYQFVLDRHPALRAAYVWEDLERPLQIVLRGLRMPVSVEDLRALDPAGQRARIAEVRRADRATPFDLGTAPLMRLHLLQVADDRLSLVWSHHHLLMDGWSAPMLSAEVAGVYFALRQGRTPQLPPVESFATYIAWLERQDLAAAEAAWRRYLAGFSRPTPVPADRPTAAGDARRGDIVRLDRKLDDAASEAFRAGARRAQVTLNTLVQAAWGLLLARASGGDDVAFGISVASRPPDLPGVESIVGCFINALPVRVRVEDERPVRDWLKRLHGEQAEMLGYSYTPLPTIQRASDVPGELPMFESVLEFWNFPVVEGGSEKNFRMSNTDYDVATNFPLSLRAIPVGDVEFQLTYDRRRFDAATIERLMDELIAAIGLLAERAEAPLGEVLEELAARDKSERRERAQAAASVAQGKLEKLKGKRRAGEPQGAR